MKVLMLHTVEDSNEFHINEPLAVVQSFTIGFRKYKWYITRADKIREGEIVDLPVSQAEGLIKLGSAKLA